MTAGIVSIDKAIKSSLQLRSKKDLIDGFIDTITADTTVINDWQKFVSQQKEIDINNIIEEQKLKPEETKKYIDNSFRDGSLKTTGTDIDRILPPVSRFGGGRSQTKGTVISKLKKLFDKYFGVV